MSSNAIADLYNLRSNVFTLFKINEFFSSHAQGELLFFFSGVDNHRAETHCRSQLNALNSNTASTTREDGPVSGTQLRFLEGGIYRRCRALSND
jgi:hypothetical protein